MLRRPLLFLLPLILLLAACAGNTTTPAAIATSTPTLQAEPTAKQPAVTPTEVAIAAPTTVPGCTVVSPMPTAGPTQESLFPAHTDYDYVSGPADAPVTIIEYFDFQ